MPFFLQVPLGVSLKSVTKYQDMVCVMHELHEYVPNISTACMVDVTDNEQAELFYDNFHKTLAQVLFECFQSLY